MQPVPVAIRDPDLSAPKFYKGASSPVAGVLISQGKSPASKQETYTKIFIHMFLVKKHRIKSRRCYVARGIAAYSFLSASSSLTVRPKDRFEFLHYPVVGWREMSLLLHRSVVGCISSPHLCYRKQQHEATPVSKCFRFKTLFPHRRTGRITPMGQVFSHGEYGAALGITVTCGKSRRCDPLDLV